MAKSPWLNISPDKGSGDKDVQLSSLQEHTGRKARTTIITFKAANCADVVRTVNQTGKPEYVDIDDTASSEQTGKVVTIAGVSNSALLTFSLGTGDLDITLPDTYIANSVDTVNGSTIAGDPGAVSVYNFSISINVPPNDDMDPHSRQIIVTDEGGHQDVCTLTLAAGEAYLRVSEGDITLDYTGSPVSIHVESNTDWTVE